MKVGLIGAPAAGKDDVVAYVLKSFGFKKFAFADQIKCCYYKDIGITEEYFKSCRGTEKEIKIRKGLWEFSDKMRKDQGPMVFIRPLIEKIKKYDNVVITDIRTEDELNEVLKIANKIIVVVRDYSKLNDDLFEETRIPTNRLKKYLTFYNYFNTVEKARKAFKEFWRINGQ